MIFFGSGSLLFRLFRILHEMCEWVSAKLYTLLRNCEFYQLVIPEVARILIRNDFFRVWTKFRIRPDPDPLQCFLVFSIQKEFRFLLFDMFATHQDSCWTRSRGCTSRSEWRRPRSWLPTRPWTRTRSRSSDPGSRSTISPRSVFVGPSRTNILLRV